MRKTSLVTITDEGRDRGKTFKLTEMPAAQAESWGLRFVLALGKSGADLPGDLDGLGMAAVVFLGVRVITQMRWEDAKPLLDEMMTCVSFVENPSRPELSRSLIETGASPDIEEVATRVRLRDAVLELHTGFSVAGVISRSIGDSSRVTPADTDPGQTTATSPEVSAQ